MKYLQPILVIIFIVFDIHICPPCLLCFICSIPFPSLSNFDHYDDDVDTSWFNNSGFNKIIIIQ
ncbi:hypothetical protein DERP_001529 [Dermatophagoides pteronyssinus]|uniref:Secreted protein n=1 Tax=Dermatophagoides pteronyssinus TaxID=6956 RepID=A0ABQ8JEN8_DERPT|nr:hypothetical protein DERP_001529 [Dermatophagoides pteronyssinus]